MTLQALKFPIGEFNFKTEYSDQKIKDWIEVIRQFPIHLNQTVRDLSNEQKNWIYRPEGWTIKQVVHHCSDSHMNSFIRFKLALTEDQPMIRPYFEDRWAELSDSLDDDLNDSLNLISSLHSKWSKFLSNIPFEDLTKIFVHPEHGTEISLAENIAFYAWHCNHHLAHIKQALNYKGTF